MEVVPIGDCKEGWDSFARQSDDAWFWHTTHYMDYTEEYSGEKLVDNLSFSVMENKETLALCPVIVESSALAEGVRQYSYSGGPIPVPAMRNDLSSDKRQRVLSILHPNAGVYRTKGGRGLCQRQGPCPLPGLTLNTPAPSPTPW